MTDAIMGIVGGTFALCCLWLLIAALFAPSAARWER